MHIMKSGKGQYRKQYNIVPAHTQSPEILHVNGAITPHYGDTHEPLTALE